MSQILKIHTFKVFALCAVLAAGATAASAQQGATRMERIFDAADANHDGVVTRAEFLSARAARFIALDRDRDGYLTPADVPPFLARMHRGEPMVRQMLAQFDADHDGRISQIEFVAGSMRLFDRADANHDGVVSRAEADAAAARLRAEYGAR